MDKNSTAVCQSIYMVIGNAVFLGVAIFGVISGILALITIPRLRLGICPSVLLFILALTDLLILGFQIPQVIVLENNYDSFSDPDRTLVWYLRSYARRLRLTLYLFEGWMVICLTLNRFIFVRWPYYDGKYMTSKCAVLSVLSLALLTLILEAPAFGKIVMSQLQDQPFITNRTMLTSERPTYPTTMYNDITTAPNDLPTHMTTINDIFTTSESIIKVTRMDSEMTTAKMLSTESINISTTLSLPPVNIVVTTINNLELSTNNIDSFDNSTNSTAQIQNEATTGEPSFAGVIFKQLLDIRDTYVTVLDRIVTTVVPIIVVIPFLATMAAMLPGGHPRMRTLSHEVIMERSAVVIMLSGVTWYVIANLPYQIFSLVTWMSGSTFKCQADLLFHVTSITLTCAFKPLIYFIVCPHFRRTLGSICSANKATKESFGTPTFDRISSRVLSTQELNISRDSRDSRGSFFDVAECTEL